MIINIIIRYYNTIYLIKTSLKYRRKLILNRAAGWNISTSISPEKVITEQKNEQKKIYKRHCRNVSKIKKKNYVSFR